MVPKASLLIIEMPPAVRALLRELGTNLAIARKRRRESLRAWAARMGVSQPTLVRMEQGDPGVAMGTYATALWMMGRARALPELAAPQLDLGALETEVRAAQTRAVRAPISLQARLRSAPATAPPAPAPPAAAAVHAAHAKRRRST